MKKNGDLNCVICLDDEKAWDKGMRLEDFNRRSLHDKPVTTH